MAESIEPHSSCTISYLIFMKLLGNVEMYQLLKIRRDIKVKYLKAILLNICNLYSRLYIFSSHFQSTCPLYEFEEGYSFSAMLDHHAWNHKHRFFFLKISSLHHPPRSFYRDAFLGPRWWGPVV